jgi:hypothetical protein
METTKNDLPQNVKTFFYKLSDYLDTKLLYYGSVQRSDYIPGKSDIDIEIFTDNESSILTKMQHFLHVKKSDFKKVVWQLGDNMVYGYKLKYENKKEQIIAEFSIYNEKFKEPILKEHTNKFVLPIYITLLLYILKFFFYQVPILPGKIYAKWKRFVLNTLMGQDDSKFLVLDSK